MAITLPVMFTSIEDAEVAYTRPISDETVRKIIQNVNMLAELAKIGQIVAVAINQPQVQTPSPLQWQQCDGSEIVQENSPLQSVGGSQRFTVDMRSHYLRGAPDESTNTYTSANLTSNISHNHTTGFVGYATVGEEGDERHGYTAPHNHPVNNDLSAAEPIDPSHLKVVYYLKIN